MSTFVDEVRIDVDVSCIVGILARERIVPQAIHVSVICELDLSTVAETGALDNGVDYAVLDGIVRFLAVEGRFRLLESLAVAVLRVILAPPAAGEGRAALLSASVRIDKPGVLLGARPAIAMRRPASWATGGVHIVDLPEVTVRRHVLVAGEQVLAGAALGLAGAKGWVDVPYRSEGATVLLVALAH